MKIARVQNASRNMFYGALLKAYQTLVPFVMRTAMIHFMGVQYLGLNSLFASILQVLNLAELGVGSAMVFSMYQPIVEDDDLTICALVRLYRRYYNAIGAVIGLVGVMITPFIPKLISGDVPAGINVYVLYLLNLGGTVLSYWLLAYKSSILQAHQRTDLISKVTIFTNTIQYGIQFLVLWWLRNYYIYILVMLAVQALSNISISIMTDKLYPQYKPIGELAGDTVKSINRRIKDLFTAKLGAVVVNSVDTIVISAFLGLSVLAIYQNYYFILTSIIGFIAVVFDACTAGIGNSLIVESKTKNFSDLKTFTFIISWISGMCACCFLNLYQPFMELWVGKDLMLEVSAVICFCVYFYVYEINRLLNTYKDAGGIWHKDRYRPLVTAFANLGMNLIAVRYWGIYGVLLSTVFSMVLVGMPWLIHNLFTTMFERAFLISYLALLLQYIGCATLSCIITYGICCMIDFDLVYVLILRGVVCCVVPNILYFCLYRKQPEFKQSLRLADKITKGRLDLSRFYE